MLNLYTEAQKIIERLKAEACPAAAELLETRITGGVTGTEVLMGLSSGLTRVAFKEKGISWKLRKDMLVLTWRIDKTIRNS